MCKYCELKKGESKVLNNGLVTNVQIMNYDGKFILYSNVPDFSKTVINYCPMCGRNLQNELSKEIKDENNKFTITDSISIKDIFKYESRFSGSDEFDEL